MQLIGFSWLFMLTTVMHSYIVGAQSGCDVTVVPMLFADAVIICSSGS